MARKTISFRHSGAPRSGEPGIDNPRRRGLWIPALAEPVIGPAEGRTRRLDRNDEQGAPA